jgi:hypothetical protein
MDEVPIYNDDPGNAKILVISDTTTGIAETFQTDVPRKPTTSPDNGCPLRIKASSLSTARKLSTNKPTKLDE